jgi:hypothetical protein
VTMKRLATVPALMVTALAMAALVAPASATAATNTGLTSIPAPNGLIEMHVTANCVQAEAKCYFNTTADLLAGGVPLGFPGETWSRQTITIRSSDRSVYQEASYSAPSGNPRELKGANHDNVLSKMYKSIADVQVSVTSFGGGPLERYKVDGEALQLDWRTGQPTTTADFIACSQIQVVYSGVNLTTPTACAQTTFS